MDADGLRRAFTQFFADNGHTVVASSGLIPTHPTAPLFTNAGMNQFVPYFLGEEPPPYPRATSVQKCIRTGDIDIIGTTTRHFTFFEMLGNFSFGDYFKEGAIDLAWKLSTEVLGLDGDRIWATVYETDDEAADIWRDQIGMPAERIQRLGDEDNFWEMQKGAPGPCGPNSELYFDRGPDFGEEGGPAHGGEERYFEFWNLVFMQYNRRPDGSLEDLPSKNVDTGAGFERNLVLLQDVPSVFETDVIRRVIATGEKLTGKRYGDDDRTDVALRIIADHVRASAFLVSDGIPPSNDERGYVVRRLIRRFVRHAYQLGVEDKLVAPDLLDTVYEVMGEAYPELTANKTTVTDIVVREEERFRDTLRTGTALLEQELADSGQVRGDVAFKLHDTYGFPIELTQEIAAERNITVDRTGFEAEMEKQRQRAKAARKTDTAAAHDVGDYREVLDRFGPTEFTGYQECESKGQVVAVLPADDGRFEVFLDRTPFYAEGGGQVGDTGTIRTENALLRVLDTTPALPGLHRHLVEVVEGDLRAGDEADALVDTHRREHTRRNHTGTHLLHAYLREVLGPQVRQQGSYVGPDRLRFDINHHEPISPDHLQEVERLVNDEVLSNQPVRAYETTMDEAKEMGALMFFGDKYGDLVRVVEAGSRSVELCGGTHLHALGGVGPLKIISEGSIGANLRRVEAVTGVASLERLRTEEHTLERAAELLRSRPDEVVDAIERLLQRQKDLDEELRSIRSELARGEARQLASDASANNGFVIARRDGLASDQLRDLAVAVRNEPEVKVVVLAGTPDGERVSLVAAVEKGVPFKAGELVVDAARAVGGGGNPKAEDLGVAGGKDVTKIDEALRLVRSKLGLS